MSCLADTGKGTVAKPEERWTGSAARLADTGKGTVAKREVDHPPARARLADTGKGTVAKPWRRSIGSSKGLADTGKGTVAKLRPRATRRGACLADTGKGTVAKLDNHLPPGHQVLPTLEKELWQSTVANQAARRMSCRHWKRNCGKADVGNCTTIRGVMSNFATDFGWILGRMGNLRGLRGEWPRGGVESVCGWVVKDRGRCTVRIG